MDGLGQSLRQVGRMFRHSPGFAAISVLTMALGIGATVSVFTVVNTVLLNPLPYEAPEDLVVLFEAHPARDIWNNSGNPGNSREWEKGSSLIENMGFISLMFPMSLTGVDRPTEVKGHYVSPDFFALLGLAPALGRTFSPGAGVESMEVVLSHDLWTEQFGGDPEILGRSVTIDGRLLEVVGVLPTAYVPFGEGSEAWIGSPLERADQRNSGRYIFTVGRLADGVSVTQAQDEMTAIALGLEETYPDFNAGWTAQVVPLEEQIVGDVRTLLWILLGAVGLLLAIASANVASLHLVRATERQHEMAIRTAIGATGGRLGKQLLAESLVLAGLGAGLGILLARWGTGLAATQLSAAFALPRVGEAGLDGRVVLFSVGVTVITAVLFGLIPALQASRVAPARVLSAEARGPSRSAGRLRSGLVVIEVALSLVLLVGAGLVTRSFSTLLAVDTGLNAEGVLTGRINAAGDAYDTDTRPVFFREITDQVAALPGVSSVGMVTFLPMNGAGSATGFWAEDRPQPPPEEMPVTGVRSVEGDYFQAMGIRLVEGRYTRETDRADAPPIVVINQAAARRLWPEEVSVLGRQVTYEWAEVVTMEVVGVVADVHGTGPAEEVKPTIYMPNAQSPSFTFMNIAVRTAGDPTVVAGPLRQIVRDLDPEVPLSDVRIMEDVVGAALARPRITTWVMGLFAALAAVLAAVGLYGVLSYAVSRRIREIGIRIAMGARPGQVVQMVVKDGMLLAGGGLILGATGFLAVVALGACLLPAWRAARVAPARSLVSD